MRRRIGSSRISPRGLQHESIADSFPGSNQDALPFLLDLDEKPAQPPRNRNIENPTVPLWPILTLLKLDWFFLQTRDVSCRQFTRYNTNALKRRTSLVTLRAFTAWLLVILTGLHMP